MFRTIPARFFQTAAVLFLVAGAALRILIWWQNRSFFIDEANLVRNFLEKPFTALLGPLDYQQYAPPLFSFFEKMMLSLFGPGERVARFLPLVFGLASLPLAWSMGRRFLSPIGLAVFCLFFAFEGGFVQYSTEAKQYSADVFIALLLIELAQRIDFQRFTWQWAIGGAAVVWFSMPAVFVLAAIGFWWIFSKKTPIIDSEISLKTSPQTTSGPLLVSPPTTSRAHFLIKTGIVFGLWLASFAAYYFFFLKKNIDNPVLRSAHVFLPFPPKSGADWQIWLGAFNGLSNWLVGFTVVAFACFYLGLVAGAWHFYKKKPVGAALIWLPPALVFAAAAMGQYSMVERLLLFVMPCVLCWVVVGWDVYLKKILGSNQLKINHLGLGLLLGAILISSATQLKYDWFYRPFQLFEHRDGLDFFSKNRQPEDVLFVHYNASPTVGHSVRFFPEKYPFGKEFVRLQVWQPEPDFLQKAVEKWRETQPTGRIFIQIPVKMTEHERLFFSEKTKFEVVFGYKGGQVFKF